jgi:hypothetical protein
MTYDFNEIERASRQVARTIPGATPTKVLVAWIVELLDGASPGERRWKPVIPKDALFGKPDQILFSGEEVDGIDREIQPPHSDR